VRLTRRERIRTKRGEKEAATKRKRLNSSEGEKGGRMREGVDIRDRIQGQFTTHERNCNETEGLPSLNPAQKQGLLPIE